MTKAARRFFSTCPLLKESVVEEAEISVSGIACAHVIGQDNAPPTAARCFIYQSLSAEAAVMFLKVVVPLVVLCLAVESSSLVGMPGAPVEADLAEQGVQNALQFAVAQHNRASNDMFVSKVSRVIKVEKQVVAGIKYIFTVDMARTSCRKDGVEEDCPIHSNPALARSHECKLAVWSQPWTKTIKVVENTCK
ncbi:hypothetical protein MHYP_G00045310 [Metynnis hypsauchen]